jgi:hypothetical protein
MAEKTKSKDPKRKPQDYDETEIPKVLKKPIPPSEPLRARKDYGEASMLKEVKPIDLTKEPIKEEGPIVKAPADYDEPCPCMKKPEDSPCAKGPGAAPVSEEMVLPGAGGKGFITILVCPDCGTEGPFNMDGPEGIPMEARTLKCAKCKTVVGFKGLVKTASGKYVSAGSSVEALVDRIRGLIKQGTVITWDIANDINVSLDGICKKIKESSRKEKDKE